MTKDLPFVDLLPPLMTSMVTDQFVERRSVERAATFESWPIFAPSTVSEAAENVPVPVADRVRQPRTRPAVWPCVGWLLRWAR
jgi:hypothetical protein